MNGTAARGTPLLDVRGLTVDFHLGYRRSPLRAVDGVDLTVAAGETVGLVGESGSGKTTIGRAILGLTTITDGTVSFAGADITHASYRERRRLSAALQIVFQDPYSSLNPTRTIGQTLAETLRVQQRLPKTEISQRVGSILERVGLGRDAANRYPTSFSGGQRQRIAIARALIVQPRLVVCDEPVSSLDLSVQAQVINLLRELQHELNLSYLFISHDLAVVRYVAHRIVVLYHGQVMEYGPAAGVCDHPTHPYTQALLGAALIPNPAQQRRRRALRAPHHQKRLVGATYHACPFADRCPHVTEICHYSRPLLDTTPYGSQVACHHWHKLQSQEIDNSTIVPVSSA